MAVLGTGLATGLLLAFGHPSAAIPAGHSHRQCHYRYHRLSVYGRMGWSRESRTLGKVNVMSGSKFWARGAERQRESEISNGAQVVAGSLTAADRCDRCGARAYVRVLLPNFLELLFCAHHNRQYASALTKIAVEIHDETGQLAGAAA